MASEKGHFPLNRETLASGGDFFFTLRARKQGIKIHKTGM